MACCADFERIVERDEMFKQILIDCNRKISDISDDFMRSRIQRFNGQSKYKNQHI